MVFPSFIFPCFFVVFPYLFDIERLASFACLICFSCLEVILSPAILLCLILFSSKFFILFERIVDYEAFNGRRTVAALYI